MHHIDDASNIRESLSKIVASNLLDSLQDDELKYIYETSTGQFWDNIVRKYPEYDRIEIKEKMFAQVFYSNSEKVEWYYKFGNEFQKQYPNAKILKIELTDRKGYDVGLSNDVDVEFDKKFNVIDIDF